MSHVGELVLDGGLADADLRQTIFTAIPREALAAAVIQVDRLTRPPDDPYFEELIAQYRRVRRFFPPVVRQIGWGAMPAGQGLLKAVQHARKLEEGHARGEAFPLQFVPPSWKYRVQPLEAVDRRAWTLCLIDRLRQALRRRDLFAAPSLRYADPRIGLLDGPAWEAARPTVCRTLGHSPVVAEAVAGLTTRLDQAYRAVAANLPRNGSVHFEPEGEGEALVLTGLDRLEEPVSLVALREAVAARLPRVDLPELLLEIQARTGFAEAFRHASEAEARAGDLPTSLCAVLLAEACNTGLEPLIRSDVPALRRSRLS